MSPRPDCAPLLRLPAAELFAAATLAALVVASRLPLAGHYLTTWDAVQYALAIEHFDVALHQPHPPGYLLYVGLLRGAHWLLGEARLAILAVNTLFGALAVAATYLVGVALYGRLSALVAALLLVVSPTMWYCGATYEPYAVLAGLSALVAWLSLRAMQEGDTRWLSAATLTLGLSAGVRPDAALFLVPLWLLALAWVAAGRAGGRLRLTAGQAVLLAVVVAAWYLPLLALSGGFRAYSGLCRAQLALCLKSNSVFFGSPWREHVLMSARHLAGAFVALGPLAALLLVAGLPRLARDGGAPLARPFLLLWALPAAAFYTLVFFSKPGYVLTYLPALALAAARAFDLLEAAARKHLPQSASAAACALLLSATLAASGLLFLAGPSPALSQAAGSPGGKPGRLLALLRGEAASVSAAAIREEDERLAVYLAALKERFSPQAAAVVCRTGSPDWRRLMYYLRDRDVYWLVDERLMRRSPNGSEFWLARGGRVAQSSSGAGFWLPGKRAERLSVPLAAETTELAIIATEGDPWLGALEGRAERLELAGGHSLLRLKLPKDELACGRFVFTRPPSAAPEPVPVVPAAMEAPAGEPHPTPRLEHASRFDSPLRGSAQWK